VLICAGVVALLAVLFLARNPILTGTLGTVLSSATGYDVRIGSSRIGTSHAVLFDVHVVKNGDPVLDAQRVDVDYALRDIFPGGAHRFGFAAIAIQSPVLTITRHADGTLTFNRAGGTPGGAPGPTRKAAEPYYFTVRVRNGAIRLVDQAPLQADLAYQQVENVSIDASVKSDARTTLKVDGELLARRSQSAPVERFPLTVRSAIDTQRGLALNTVRARELPLRGALGFLIHSKAVRFDAGVIDDVAVLAYGIGKPGLPFAYRLGGGLTLRGGRLAIAALQRPLRDLGGRLTITDDALATTALSGTVGGLPLSGRGALYSLFDRPAFWLGLRGDGDLTALRGLFGFSSKLPLRGPVHVETLLSSKLAQPLIRNAFAAPSIAYDRFPIAALDGVADVFDGDVFVQGVRARYGAADVSVGGRILFDPRGTDVNLAVNARGPGAALPYTDAIAPDSAIDLTVLLAEPPRARRFTARGTLLADGPTAGAGTFAVDGRGVGAFGPFDFGRPDGSALAGGFELERPVSQSAGWVHLRSFRLADVRRLANLPGTVVPGLPPVSGVLDGDLAGGGTPDQFGLSGRLSGRELRYQNYVLGQGSVRLGGTFADVRLSDIALDGPLGRFGGDGAYADKLFALQGRYDGTLEALRPLTGDQKASGGVHGPVRVTLAQNRIVVQSDGAALDRAQVRGVAVDGVAGTIAIEGKNLRVVAADGSLGGGRVVAQDAGGPFLVSTPSLPVAALRGAGLPLGAGALAVFGLADLRGKQPRFDGAVALSDGVVRGYPISGDADLTYADGGARVRSGVAALGATYGSFAGDVAAVGTRAMAYDLDASVPLGDVAEVRHVLGLPLHALEGSFSADVRVRGTGARPRVAGDVRAPEGSYNGLAFRDARAQLVASPGAVAARNGTITVGTTQAQVDTSVAGRAFSVDVRAERANLADFNDYFDAAETLDGQGRVAFALANDGRTTRTTGRIDVSGLRFRRFPFGSTAANWSQRGGTVAGALAVRSEHGSLRAGGTVVPAAGDLPAALRGGSYRLSADARAVDLNTWLPPFGLTAPILGQVDLRGSAAGRYPRLGVDADATLRNGSVYGYAVQAAHAHARSDGARIALADTSADFGFAQFSASGSFGLGLRDPLALAIHLQSTDIAKALARLEPKAHYDVAGALQADARIGGTLVAPRAVLGFAATGARYASLTIPRILGNVASDGNTLEVRDVEATFPKGSVLLAGSLPISLQPPGVRAHAPFSFTVGLTGLDLVPFAPFVPGPHTKLGGTVDGRVAIEGTREAPRVIGSVTLAGGSYVSDFERAAINGANARLAFEGTSVALQALHAGVGGGTLDGSGRLDLPFPNAPSGGYAVDLSAHRARLDLPQYGTGQVDGSLRLVSARPLPLLSGDVTLSNASIPFAAIARGAGGGAAAGPAKPAGLNLAFDLMARAGRNVRVQSSIIDIGATGLLDLTGTLAAPKLAGTLTATPGGIFSSYNRVFRVQQAAVRFNAADGVMPYVDLRAFAHVTNPDPDPTRNAIGSADITVLAQGPADEIASGAQPLQFSSNPPYGQEQIVGLLLDASVFGAVNFGSQNNGTTLRGAPGISNPLLPPGVTPYQSGVINFNQEAFSILNGQLTQRFLAPVERFFTGRFGLTDLELTTDYGGGVGYNALKQIDHRDVYASFGQTLTAPNRTTLGFTSRPDAVTSIVFNYFQQNGVYALTTNANGTSPFSNPQRLKGIQPLNGRSGFTFAITRKYP
jgi:autotransporter translocation and assembly factor TamB